MKIVSNWYSYTSKGQNPSSEFIYIGQKIKYGEFSLICVFWQICDVSRGKIPA